MYQLLILLLLADIQTFAQSESPFAEKEATKISSQFSFTEGPARDKKGDVYFTDQPNNTIWKYNKKGELTLFLKDTGRSNGLYFDKKGNLLSCADEKFELWSIKKDGSHEVLLSAIDNKEMNGPNDLWIAPKSGLIYFTDPYYQRDYWTRKKPQLAAERLYYFNQKTKELTTISDDFVKPNGIVGTKDGKTLYVADIGANKTYRYEIKEDGSLGERILFLNKGSDGMTIDEAGNVYLTGDGVSAYNPSGEEIGHIAIAEKWTANVCFSGKKKDFLFITASKSIYKIKMKIKGV
ncbi:MAG: SMP-30/gluconolactonase/LRE family protein [Pelobium sp.]